MQTQGITYKESGVDIDHAESALKQIHHTRSRLKDVLLGANDFAGMFSLADISKTMADPILVSSTDGVGTKLLVAIEYNDFSNLGQDLVAACANDIAAKGADPLFFLDYFSCGNLKQVPFVKVVNNMVETCDQINCALIGGETAEMPSFYNASHFDLAGFIVGIVDRQKLLGRHRVKEGDIILGLTSSGLHANGFSLVRKVIFDKLHLRANDVLWQDEKGVCTVANELLRPTKLYGPTINKLQSENLTIHAAAHISGGGLLDNVPRAIPPNLSANIQLAPKFIPNIFDFLGQNGPISDEELFRTFNMGVGMALIVPPDQAPKFLSLLKSWGEEGFILGDVRKNTGKSCTVTRVLEN